MRILQVIPSIAASVGGPSVVARELNRSFRSLGHDARLVTIGSPQPDQDDLGSVEIRYCRPTGPPSLELSIGLFRTVVRLARSTDIIAMDGFYNAHAAACYMSARLYDKPIVVQPHGVFDRRQRTQSPALKRMFDAVVGHRLLDRASAIHFSSDLEREGFEPATTNAQLAVVPHGTELPPPEPAEQIRSWLTTGGYSKVCCSIGRLAAKKQPELLIKAWSRVRTPSDSCLVVAGSEGDWTVSQLRDLARAEGARNVFVHGHLRRPEVTWLLRRSGVFVLPSLEENFGLTILEALSEACYVISTTAVGASSFVEDGRSGRVLDSPTVESMGQELLWALHHWSEVVDRSTAEPDGAALVSWEQSARALIGLYTQVLERAGARDR